MKPVIVLSEVEVLERLSLKLVFESVEQALIAAADGSGSINQVVIGNGIAKGETFSLKSGVAEHRRVVGVKVGAYWPGNAKFGLACHGSSIFLLDPDTGRLMAVIEASRLNGPRTAAADAVAAHALASPDATTLTVIGAGQQAAHEVRALCAIRPIKRVLIAARTEYRAKELQTKLSSELATDVETTEIEQGCREADILATVTSSRTPLFESKWLKAGTHVAAMGSDQRGKQELPPDLLHRARLFSDLPSQSLAIGEFQHIKAEVESGALALTAIGDVLLDRGAGRQSADEITVFDSSGLALQDLFVAADILRAGPSV